MPSLEDQKFANLVNALNEVLARQNQLDARLEKLEQAMRGDAAPLDVVKVVETPATAVEQPVAEVAGEAVPEQPVVVNRAAEKIEHDLSPALETKFGLTIVNRIGVVTLVLGVGFFFKWAVDNNWIGPSGRVVLGLLAGFATLAFADLLWRKKQKIFAQGITGTGVAIIYLALFAAFDFYHLIGQTTAFFLLLSTTAMAGVLALRYNAIAIAGLGFFGAYLIPLLLSNGDDHPWFLFAYLLLINFAAAELARRRQWRLLELFSFIASVLIAGKWAIDEGTRAEDRVPATVGILALCAQRFRMPWRILFLIGQFLTAASVAYIWSREPAVFFPTALFVAAGALAFAHLRSYLAVVPTAFCIFWISTWFVFPHTAANLLPVTTLGFLLFAAWSWWRSGLPSEPPSARSMFVFALNGVLYYSEAYSLLRRDYHHWLGLLALAVAASYLSFGILLYRKSAQREQELRMVLLALGIAIAFLTLAIPIQLTGFSVTMAWSIQGAALSWIGWRIKSTRAVLAALAIFALGVVRAAAVDSRMYSDFNAYSLLVNSRFLTFAVLATGLLLGAYWSAKLDRQLALVPFIAGHVVMLGGLCLEVTGAAQRTASAQNEVSVETIGITILFASYAVMLVSVGVATRSAVNRLAGLVLTGFVILKLYLFDVWQLGRVYQIVAFVILGVLLLSTSFLYSRFKGLVDAWWRELPKRETDETSIR